MSTHSTNTAAKIDRLRIATPCPISWEQMTGDNRVRFCAHCQLNVYNISELSRIEAESLIASTEGRLCARMYRRADGTVLTKDCPVGLRALRMRVSKRAAAVFAAIASLSGGAFGQQPTHKDGKTSCTPQARITRTIAPERAATTLSGIVVDQSSAVIPGATVTMTNADMKEMRKTSTDDEGRFQFDSLAAGNYSLKIEATGFKNLVTTNVVVENKQLLDMHLILEAAGETVTVGLIAAESLIDPLSSSITFTISGDQIRRLPLPK